MLVKRRYTFRAHMLPSVFSQKTNLLPRKSKQSNWNQTLTFIEKHFRIKNHWKSSVDSFFTYSKKTVKQEQKQKKRHVCVVETVKRAFHGRVVSTEVTVEFQVANAKVPRSWCVCGWTGQNQPEIPKGK